MRQNFIFIQSANLNDLSYEALLSSSLLSEQVIQQSAGLDDKRKKQFVACRYLLAELLNEHFDVDQLPNIKIGDNSRPQFEKVNLPDFNISHSGNFIAVAISSTGKIGLDIELARARQNAKKIAMQFFSQQENEWLTQQSDPLNAFWQLWTLRESALKLYAKGVWQMKELAIAMPTQQITAKFATDFYPYHQQLEQIYLSICCSHPIHSIVINE
ncbi:4'-phosphopantetheinyl transferase [Orbus hercynius]|uniref:4'-phosphopantetheinyl transferase n=1 Tax=Orbus hercynius TaxID=593135 RepID=A0A495REN1_9GAMM|nr:4'-phosphopantetheinyl transferase superfamily protein [Orbus hercynius]RKS85821.1 4'-phosphopantetheinyl transferase [Orbus hercynius]